MPRPGPRPYECVRRAWHSERHQPTRGSIIKEIFRVAHEIHSPLTKKNKEWQEKLPIVVLKAEEIIYSKANSEAEYVDLKTLWERVSDAIDTIIRREESSETGELLQPCIEAALNLGCIPRRASRSQRNSNPRFYLGAYTLDKPNQPPNPTPPLVTQDLNLFSPATLCPKLPRNDPHDCNPNTMAAPSYPPYPLHYMAYPQPTFGNGEISPCDEDHPEEVACDLSLRLAPLSVSAPRAKRAAQNLNVEPENEDVGLRGLKEVPVCRWGNLMPSLGLSSGVAEGGQMRKRRAVEAVEDVQFPWRPTKVVCTYSGGGSARLAGL